MTREDVKMFFRITGMLLTEALPAEIGLAWTQHKKQIQAGLLAVVMLITFGGFIVLLPNVALAFIGVLFLGGIWYGVMIVIGDLLRGK